MREVAELADKISYAVDKIKDVRKEYGNYQVLASWKEFSNTSDSWEPLQIMDEGVPTKVRKFFNVTSISSIVGNAMRYVRLQAIQRVL